MYKNRVRPEVYATPSLLASTHTVTPAPLLGGMAHTISVEDTNDTPEASKSPKRIAAVAAKLVPISSTFPPPDTEPYDGTTTSTTGSATYKNCNVCALYRVLAS
jgi:hypothetical protein